MRNLILLLIVFLAVVTFIRVFDRVDAETLSEKTRQTVLEARINN